MPWRQAYCSLDTTQSCIRTDQRSTVVQLVSNQAVLTFDRPVDLQFANVQRGNPCYNHKHFGYNLKPTQQCMLEGRQRGGAQRRRAAQRRWALPLQGGPAGTRSSPAGRPRWPGPRRAPRGCCHGWAAPRGPQRTSRRSRCAAAAPPP